MNSWPPWLRLAPGREGPQLAEVQGRRPPDADQRHPHELDGGGAADAVRANCRWARAGMRLTARRAVAGRPTRRDSVEHALYAYVFVNLRPAYPRTTADDLESGTLLRSCLGESPGPGQRNTNRPAVRQLGRNCVIGDRNTLNTSLDVSC